MTRTAGTSLIATPCCRSLYTTPRYGSVNFSAYLFWTDGHKEGSLMPSGGGLRKCSCGEFYLLAETISLGLEAAPDTPPAQFVEDADLPGATQSHRKAVELVARREYWRFLNHGYRDLYREHREQEEKASQAKWRAEWHTVNPDTRPRWLKLVDVIRFRKLASPPPMPNKLFSVPNYQPTQLQQGNMVQLLELLVEGGKEKFDTDPIEVAELYRQLGRLDEATTVLQTCTEERNVTRNVVKQMIDSGITAPVRYRM